MLKKDTNPLTSKTGKRIAEIFWQLYRSGGMANISVTKICELADYNRSTFYANYEDIYDVLNQIELSLISPSEFQAIILQKLLTSSPAEAILTSVIALFERNEEYFPILLGPDGDPAFRKKILQSLLPTITTTVQRTKAEYPLFLYTLEYQNAAVFSVIALWYQRGKDISQEALIQLLIRLTTSGIRQELLPPSDR